jgi:Ca2+-binding RTX toxin-like protein
LIYGGSGPGVLYGGDGNDTLYGGSGPETISGGSGNDVIYGGSGPETIDGGSGNNIIYAGSGPDLISETGPGGHDTVFGFDHAGGDAISFAGQNSPTVQQVVATAQESHGNTMITLPDGSTITLLGVTHIDSGFFH